MSTRKPQRLALTRSALAAINDIEQFSVENWGKKVAERYIADLEVGLVRIQEEPELEPTLKREVEILHEKLRRARPKK